MGQQRQRSAAAKHGTLKTDRKPPEADKKQRRILFTGFMREHGPTNTLIFDF